MEKLERDFKGIWIPKAIWLSEKLTLQEKVLLVEINSLDGEKGCYASNQYFADFFGLSKDRISKLVSSLKLKGFIDVKVTYKAGTKEIDKRIIKILDIEKEEKKQDEVIVNSSSEKTDKGIVENTDTLSAKTTRGIVENNFYLSAKTTRGIVENAEDNNTYNNIYNNNIINNNISEKLKLKILEYIQYRKEIKKPLKTDRPIKALIKKIGKEYVSENHLIDSIQQAMDFEYQGVFPIKNYKEISNQSIEERMKEMKNILERGRNNVK